MSVVVGGARPPHPADWASGIAVETVGLDPAELERALVDGADRVVLVGSPGTPPGPINRMGFDLLGPARARVVMVVHLARTPTGGDLARWCDSTERFAAWDAAVRIPLAAGGVAPAHIRRAMSDRIGSSVSGDVMTSAALAASELVSNALQHVGDGRFELRMADGEIGLAVFDAQPGSWPALRESAPLADAGRGLGIVANVADAWGITAGPEEKAVWCELR